MSSCGTSEISCACERSSSSTAQAKPSFGSTTPRSRGIGGGAVGRHGRLAGGADLAEEGFSAGELLRVAGAAAELERRHPDLVACLELLGRVDTLPPPGARLARVALQPVVDALEPAGGRQGLAVELRLFSRGLAGLLRLFPPGPPPALFGLPAPGQVGPGHPEARPGAVETAQL